MGLLFMGLGGNRLDAIAMKTAYSLAGANAMFCGFSRLVMCLMKKTM